MDALFDILAPLEQEGTRASVRNWMKSLGESVTEGEPLVELETDKVTQEVAAPASGILAEILLTDGDEAGPASILGRIKLSSAEVTAPPAAQTGTELAASHSWEPHEASRMAAQYSPSVRRAAAEYGIDPADLTGTGRGGRVTRADMEQEQTRRLAEKSAPPAAVSADLTAPPERILAGADRLPQAEILSSRSVPHSSMRLAIARHMVQSLATAPQVTSVFEADLTAISRHRAKNKARFEAEGIKLSFTSYFIAAAAAAMKVVPEVNSRWHDDRLEIFGQVNLGVGTALGDKGLVVPVIRRVDELSLQGIAVQLQEMTERARSGSLGAKDLQGGTFTLSNHGVSGSLFAAPIIINQPQNAILGIGKLEKRVIVREVDGEDVIQIRPMAYVSLTIDHRALDAHQANRWLTAFVSTLETWAV